MYQGQKCFATEYTTELYILVQCAIHSSSVFAYTKWHTADLLSIGVTLSGIEPRPPAPRADALTIMPRSAIFYRDEYSTYSEREVKTGLPIIAHNIEFK